MAPAGPAARSALAWAERLLGARVVSARARRDGVSSAVHLLVFETGSGSRGRVVLRRYVRPELNAEEPYIAARAMGCRCTSDMLNTSPEVSFRRGMSMWCAATGLSLPAIGRTALAIIIDSTNTADAFPSQPKRTSVWPGHRIGRYAGLDSGKV